MLDPERSEGSHNRSTFGHHAKPAKNGLCSFSSPTVVIGPCPGQMIVSLGNVRIFSTIILYRIAVGNVAAAHRSGKKRVAHDRDGMRESGHDECRSAGRMSPGQSRFDLAVCRA